MQKEWAGTTYSLDGEAFRHASALTPLTHALSLTAPFFATQSQQPETFLAFSFATFDSFVSFHKLKLNLGHGVVQVGSAKVEVNIPTASGTHGPYLPHFTQGRSCKALLFSLYFPNYLSKKNQRNKKLRSGWGH